MSRRAISMGIIVLFFLVLGIILFQHHAYRLHMRRMAVQRMVFGMGYICIAKVIDDGDTYQLRDVKQLTHEKDRFCQVPQFSPDGKTIVFTESGPGLLHPCTIYRVGADGSHLRWLTPDPDNTHGYLGPVFTPDGQTIIFYSSRGSTIPGIWKGYNYSIYSMKADGSHITRLTHAPDSGSDYNPAVSPDGKSIAYIHHDLGNDYLYVMDSDGGHQRDLYSKPGITLGCPQFTPDGRRIYFSCDSPAGKYGACTIGCINLDGSGCKILPVIARDYYFGISPYGDRIVYRADDTYLHAMRLDGSRQSNIPLAIVHGSFHQYLGSGMIDFFPSHALKDLH